MSDMAKYEKARKLKDHIAQVRKDYAADMKSSDVARQQKHELKLAHLWPVRVPRPVKEKLPGNAALVTGQRV